MIRKNENTQIDNNKGPRKKKPQRSPYKAGDQNIFHSSKVFAQARSASGPLSYIIHLFTLSRPVLLIMETFYVSALDISEGNSPLTS